MLEVRIREDSRGRLASFFAEGHAGWAEAGTDVVCAAVSTLLQAAWLGLQEHAKVAVKSSRRSGRLELIWPAESREREDVRAIVATTALSLECIAAQYPSHVRVVREQEPKEKPLSAREG
jgi:uncharacterized protein YsxB (DUF464 family)